MRITYYDALTRLKEERLRLSLSQNEMSQIIHITQSNYSKVEQVMRRLSYYELIYLCNTDIDVHYIFTGQKKNNKYSDLLDNCTFSEAICYLNIIYSIAMYHYRQENNDLWESIFTRINYIVLIEENHIENIWLKLRHFVNWKQQKMADELGVDIKKLRDLENGRKLPDSELLYRLYKVFHIPPSIILKDRAGILSEISILLGMMDELSEKKVCRIFNLLKE